MQGALGRGAAGPRDHAHAEARAEPRHLHANGPEADEAQRLAAQFHPHEPTGLPAALAQAHVRGADMPRGGEDHGEAVLGHRGGSIIRRVRDDHAAAGRLLHVDAARVADAEEADELEALKLYEMDGFDQTQAAEKMKISQPTFARILDKSIKKITEAIIKGKAIKIEKT